MDIPSGPSLRPERDSGAGRRHAASPCESADTACRDSRGIVPKDKATGIPVAYRPAAPRRSGTRGLLAGTAGARVGSFRLRGSGSAGSRRSLNAVPPRGHSVPEHNGGVGI